MNRVSICNPDTRSAFTTFKHNTTTYVNVPHEAHSVLWVTTDAPSRVVILSEGEVVLTKDIDVADQISLSELSVPFSPKASRPFFPPIISALWRPSSRTQAAHCPVNADVPRHRLYQFTVELKDQSTDHVHATFDFHILCEQDFALAHSCHLAIQHDPDVIAPDTIASRSEGQVCDRCRQDSAALEALKR